MTPQTASSPRTEPSRAALGSAVGFRSESLPVPALLADRVGEIWLYQHWGRADRQALLPDPCAEIVVELGCGDPVVAVRGPSPHPCRSRCRRPDGGLLSVRLRPGLVRALFEVPAHELQGRELDVGDLGSLDWLGELRRRAEDALGDLPIPSGVPPLERILAPLAEGPRGTCRPPSWTSRAILLSQQDGRAGVVSRISARLGVSRQALARSFRDHVGLSPKQLARSARLQRTIRQLGSEHVDWADLSLQLGFYDQSHLIAELTGSVGISPQALSRRLRRGRATVLRPWRIATRVPNRRVPDRPRGPERGGAEPAG